MSNLDGENSYIYNKTLSGLDSLGDTEIGDLTVNGTLTVVGLSSFESDIEMNTNFIHGLADGLLPQDAATVNQITGIAGFLKIDGTNAMTATMDVFSLGRKHNDGRQHSGRCESNNRISRWNTCDRWGDIRADDFAGRN